MSSTGWITSIAAPTLGLILANFMWLSPCKAVLEARKTRNIGTLNPFPFLMTVFNCIAWIIYSCLKKDIFIFLANASGLVLGLFYSLTCITILSKKTEQEEFSELYTRIEAMLLFAFFFWSTIGFVCATSFSGFDNQVEQMSALVGTLGSSFAIAYYTAPLSTMAEIIQKRDSSSLMLSMTAINLINATMWTLYGTALGDINVWGPNIIGMVLSSLQLILIFIFPKKANAATAIKTTDEECEHEANNIEVTKNPLN